MCKTAGCETKDEAELWQNIKEAFDGADREKPVILFVCTGNTCRSPMAEAVFNRDYVSSGYRAESAGLYADGVSPISENAARALADAGYGETEHISQRITAEAVEKAAAVIGITGSHAMQLVMMFPEQASKIRCLPKDIADPYGGDLEVYKRCLSELREALALLAGEGSGNEKP